MRLLFSFLFFLLRLIGQKALFPLLFGITTLAGLPVLWAQCDCPNPGTNFSTPVGPVNLNPNISNSNGPTGCLQYQQISGFVEGRKYLFSFCPDKFQGAKFPQGVPLLLLLKNAGNQTVATSPNNTNCNDGGYTLEMIAPSTGAFRAYVFSMPGCSVLTPNSNEARNTQFGYREDCNEGTLEKQGETCPFTLVYKNPSGAENYQLQYWNGSNWVNYERAGNRQGWQNASPNYVFPNVAVKETTRFRVLHLGGNCNGNEVSNEITLAIPPQCPTHLRDNLNITSSRTRYCTNGTLDLRLEDDCLPAAAIDFRWIGTGVPNDNRSSISFPVPNTILPPAPCSSYSYQAQVTFRNIPGCTLTSKAHTVNVCKILPFTLDTLPPLSGVICQNQVTRLQIAPDSGWVIPNFQDAVRTSGYSFTWNCNGCNGGNPSINSMQTNSLSWQNNCGGDINVSVIQNIEGCQSANPVNYRVNIKCQGDSRFALSPGPACINGANSASVIQARATAPPAPGVAYTWDCDGCLSPPPGTQGPHTLSWSTGGVKTIRLTAVSNSPCSTAVTTQTVLIDSPFTLQGNCGPESLCVNQSTVISVTPAPAPAPPSAVTYTWNCDGCTPPPGNRPSANISWSIPGTKTVRITATSAGCPNDPAVFICNPVVFAAPNANFNLNRPAACINGANSTSEIQATAAAQPAPGVAYTWDCDGCLSPPPGAQGPHTLSWSTGGTKTIRLTAVSNSPCSTAVTTQTVLIDSPFTLQGNCGPESLCVNQSTVISVTPAPAPPSSVTYTWNCDGCTPPPGNRPSANISWSIPGTKTVRITATSAGCPNDPVSFTCNPVVFAVPNANFNLNRREACINGANSTSEIQATAAPTAPGVTYSWDCDGCLSPPPGTQGPHTLSWSSAGIKTIRLAAESSGPCPRAVTTQTVLIDSPFTLQGNCGPESLCVNQSTVISVTPAPAPLSAVTYTWNCDGCTPPPGNRPSANISWSIPGTKTVRITTTSAGCPNDPASFTCNPIVLARPQTPTVSFNGGSSPFCLTQTVNLTITHPIGSAVIYDWRLSGPESRQGTDTQVEFTGLREGVYTFNATVTDPNLPENCRQSAGATLTFTVNRPASCELRAGRNRISLGDTTRLYNYQAAQVCASGWQFDGGALGPGDAPGQRVIRFTTVGTKTVTLCVVSPGCPQTTCTQVIEVVDCPNNQVGLAFEDRTYCPGQTLQNLRLTNDQPQFAKTWRIRVPQGTTETVSEPERYVFRASGVYTLTLEVRSPDPTCPSFTINRNITVGALPELSALQAQASACPGEEVTITPVPANLPAGSTYLWETQGLPAYTQGAPNMRGAVRLRWANPGVYTVSLTETTPHCGAQVASIVITVNPAPAIPELRLLQRCPEISGERLILQPVPPPAGSLVVELYTQPTGGTRIARLRSSAPAYTGTFTANPNIYYTALDTATGCAAAGPRRQFTETLQRLAILSPISGRTVCVNDTLHLNARVYRDLNGQPVPIVWRAQDIPQLSPNNVWNQLPARWGGAGTKTISLTASAPGCPTVTLTVSVNVIAKPEARITVSGEGCVNNRLSVRGEIIGAAGGALQYRWNCDGCQTTPPNVTTLGPFQASWVQSGDKTLSLTVLGHVCGELKTEKVQAIRVPPLPVACNYPQILCARASVTLTFAGLLASQSPEFYATYNTPTPVPNPGAFPSGNRVSINGNKAEILIQRNDTVFYGVRDTASNCPSLYRLPIELRLDTSIRLVPPLVTNSPVTICNQGQPSFRINMNDDEYSRYFLIKRSGAVYTDTLRNINQREFVADFPLIGTTSTFYIQKYHPGTGCVSESVALEARVLRPTPRVMQCPPPVCAGERVAFTLNPSSEGGRIAVYAVGQTAPLAVLSSPYTYVSGSLTTNTEFFFSQIIDSPIACTTALQRQPRCQVNVKPRPEAPSVRKPILEMCQAGTITFTFTPPSGAPNSAIYIYDALNSPIEIDLARTLPGTSDLGFVTPVLTQTTRYFAAVKDPLTSCESQRIPLEVRFLREPQIEASLTSPGCKPGLSNIFIRVAGDVDTVMITPTNGGATLRLPVNGDSLKTTYYVTTTTTFFIQAKNNCGAVSAQQKEAVIYPEVKIQSLVVECSNNSYYCIRGGAIGGSRPGGEYQYQISGGTNTSDTLNFCNLNPGVYTITACDREYIGCCDTKTITIKCAPPVNFRVEVELNPDCENGGIWARWNNSNCNRPIHYEISYRYKGKSDSTWSAPQTVAGYLGEYKFLGLDGETFYEARIRSICDGASFSEYQFFEFKTEVCNTPNELVYAKLTDSTAKITVTQNVVNPFCNPMVYHFCYAPQGDPRETLCISQMQDYQTVYGNEINIAVERGVNYTAAVRAVCYGGSVITDMYREPFTHPRLGNTKTQAGSAFQLYPNPSKGRVTLSFNAEIAASFRLQIVNALGSAVYEKELEAQAGFNAWEIALPEEASSGVYWARLSDFEGASVFAQPLILQK